MPQYPVFEVEEDEVGFYSSLPKAEEGIYQHINELKERDLNQHDGVKKINDLLYHEPKYNQTWTYDYGELYCFHITEIKLNCYGYNYPNVKTRRSYLPDGTLFNESLTSEVDCPWDIEIDSEKYSVEELAQLGAFAGRSPKQIRFRKGEIVELLGSSTVELGIVVGVPSTVQEMIARGAHFGQQGTDFGDYSDDFYRILIGDKVYNYKEGDDPEEFNDACPCLAVDVFPPRFPVPPELQEVLHKAYLAWVAPSNSSGTKACCKHNIGSESGTGL
ncbi:hypothetical protein AGMMS4957_09620 [Bacteroidia bacterium]|nr:hypothetical protein AGMMS4957_09620 [Bacteroidia bacterium]